MTYEVIRKVKGIPYRYEQKSWREGKKVRTKTIRYIGPVNPRSQHRGSNKIQPQDTPKKLDTTLKREHTEDLTNPKLASNETKSDTGGEIDSTNIGDESIKNNVVAGAKLDKRSNKVIANDMQKDSKVIHKNPNDWKDEKGTSDLKGWDTTHIKDHVGSHKKTLSEVKRDLSNTYPDAKIEGRTKELHSTVGKIKTKNQKERFTQYDMQDLTGTRITVKNIREEKLAIKKLQQNYEVVEVEDYVKHPKEQGYRSIHAIIIYKGKPVEVQIRTKNQTKWADWGHDVLYKGRNETRKKVGNTGLKQADKYNKDMAKYYYQVDIGHNPTKPNLPLELKGKIREMPDATNNKLDTTNKFKAVRSKDYDLKPDEEKAVNELEDVYGKTLTINDLKDKGFTEKRINQITKSGDFYSPKKDIFVRLG